VTTVGHVRTHEPSHPAGEDKEGHDDRQQHGQRSGDSHALAGVQAFQKSFS